MSQASGARILVVDDEPAIVRAVELNLRRHQFQVNSVRSGQAAFEAYIRVRPDLVLLDLEPRAACRPNFWGRSGEWTMAAH